MTVRIERSETEFGSATRATRAVDPRLRGVLCRPLLGFEQRDARFGGWLEPPRPALTLMIDVAGAIVADGEPLPGAWLAGLDDRPVRVGVSDHYAALEVTLTPLGAYALVGRPLSELRATTAPLGAVFGRAGDELVERVREAPDWAARFATLDAFLLARLDAGPRPSPDTAWAWRRLRETGGRMRIDALAAELGCSRRHLSARFAEQVGLPPKAIARLRRFERFCLGLDRAPAGWADLALDCGFADQSHLAREVRALAGTTPGDLVARRMPGGGYHGD